MISNLNFDNSHKIKNLTLSKIVSATNAFKRFVMDGSTLIDSSQAICLSGYRWLPQYLFNKVDLITFPHENSWTFHFNINWPGIAWDQVGKVWLSHNLSEKGSRKFPRRNQHMQCPYIFGLTFNLHGRYIQSKQSPKNKTKMAWLLMRWYETKVRSAIIKISPWKDPIDS